MRSVRGTLLALALTSQAHTAANAQPPTLVRDGVASTDPGVAAQLPRYLAAHSAHFIDWLADGSMLIASRSADLSQIQRLRAPLDSPEPVSFAPAGVSAAVARPYTSDAFIYVTPHRTAGPAGAADGELAAAGDAQLYLQQLGAAARPIGDTRSDAGAPVWAHDGTRVAFVGAGDTGVFVLDTAHPDAQARLVSVAGGAHWCVLGWSIDDRTLLLGREPATPTDEDPGERLGSGAAASGTGDARLSGDVQLELYLAAVDGGTVLPIPAPGARLRAARAARTQGSSPSERTVAALATSARFASDGHAVLLLTRQPCQGRRDASSAHEFLHLCYTDPATGEWRQLSAPAAHDVELFDVSADGSFLAYTLNDDGVSRLVLMDQKLQLESAVTALSPGVISTVKFDPLSRRLALLFESAGSTPDVYVLDPHTRALARWTRGDAEPLDAAAFAQPQLLHFPTWDQVDGQPRQLSALLYGPTGAAALASAPHPVVIWLCGGGGRQCRTGYAPFVQFLVQQLGFTVVAPNVRGSSGFGASFEAAGADPLRDDAVRDVGSLLVWIGLQPGLDRSRVALFGEGFGSYLALASLGQFGDRLNGAVAAFPARLWPLPNALAIRRPVLLVQGLSDPNVPAYQGAQLREGLRASGVTVQYLAAGEEASRFARQSNSEAYYEAAATFLARLLH